MCIRVGVEIPFNVFRGSGIDSGYPLLVRGVSPGAVIKLAKSLKAGGIRIMGNVSARQRWVTATMEECKEYATQYGASYVRTNQTGFQDVYQILVLDIFDGNHRWHATYQLMTEGSLVANKVYFQTAVYDELLPDVVAELTGRLLNDDRMFANFDRMLAVLSLGNTAHRAHLAHRVHLALGLFNIRESEMDNASCENKARHFQ